MLGIAGPCQVCFTSPPVHLDPHTCLLQGPILRVCVLAVLLIGRRQQETMYHSLPTLSHPWGPEHIWRPNLKRGTGQPREMIMGTVSTQLAWDPDRMIWGPPRREKGPVKDVLGVAGDTFLHRKTFSDCSRLKAW